MFLLELILICVVVGTVGAGAILIAIKVGGFVGPLILIGAIILVIGVYDHLRVKRVNEESARSRRDQLNEE